MVGLSSSQTAVMVVRRIDMKSFGLKKTTQQVDESVIVIDDEQLIHRTNFAFSRLRLR